MKKNNLTFLLLTVAFLSKAQLPVDYIRTGEYEETRLTVKDFKKIISSINYYYQNTEKDSLDKYNRPYLKCDIVRSDKALTLSSFKQVNSFDIEDDSYSEVSIYYRWDSKSISSVNIDLHKSFRRMTIKGYDEKKVEALFHDLDSKLKGAEASFSWLDFEFIIPMLFSSLFIFSMFIFPAIVYYLIKGLRDRRATFILIVTGVYSIIGLVFFFSKKSIRDFFPGFELTPDNTTWIDRNANLLGFIGLILAIIPPFIAFFKWGMTKTNAEEERENNADDVAKNKNSKSKKHKA